MSTGDFRVFCNPYHKTISYEYYDVKNGWKAPDVTGDLSKAKYTKEVSLQRLGSDLFDKILAYKNGSVFRDGNHVYQINFCGTPDDWRDFEKMFSWYAQQEGRKKDASAVKLVYEMKLPSASQAMQVIEEEYAQIDKNCAEFLSTDIKTNSQRNSNQVLSDKICSFKEITKPQITLCVVGHYSAGKSTFINALIGCEILPSAAKAETARIVTIREPKDGCPAFSVCLAYQGREILIQWESTGRYAYATEGDSYQELANQLDEVMSTGNTPETQIYSLLSWLNKPIEPNGEQLAKEIGDTVHITIPINNPFLKRSNYKIIDTPGSNSESNKETHLKTLNKNLESQTNALPVFICECKQVDSIDAAKLYQGVQAIGSKIDLVNGIYVINQADRMEHTDIRGQQDSRAFNMLRRHKVLYTSAAVALGDKKGDIPWLDNGAKRVYRTGLERFDGSSAEEDRLELYKYNAVDPISAEYVRQGVEQESLVLRNSGMADISYYIEQFGEKHAGYLKCEQSAQYLKDISNDLDELIAEKEQALSKEQGRYRKEQKEKRMQLTSSIKGVNLDDLKTTKDRLYSEYTKKKDEALPSIRKKMNDSYTVIRKGREGKVYRKELEEMKKAMNEELISCANAVLYKSCSVQIKDEIANAQERASEQYKQKILKKIFEDEYLSKSEKEILRGIGKEKPELIPANEELLINEDILTPKKFLFWTIKPSKKAYLDACIDAINADFLVRCIDPPIKQAKNNMEAWKNRDIKEKYIDKIDEHNFTIRMYADKIADIQQDIDAQKRLRDMLHESRHKIDQLLSDYLSEKED